MNAEAGLPSTWRLLGRGLVRRCPRCGSRHLFDGWFRMVRTCPRCHYLFDREEGFFLGAFVINFAATEALLAVVIGVMIAMLASGSNQSLVPIIVAAVAETLVMPIVGYPFSKTTWAAIDLAMHRNEAWAR